MPTERGPDPYAVLNVARSATAKEIRAAYRALAKKYHPDLHQGNPLQDLAGARLAEVNRAYQTLSDAKRRAAYDAGAEAGAAPEHPHAAPAGPAFSKRIVGGAVVLILLPFVVRLGAGAVRGLAGLGRSLFELAASLPGGRLAAAAALALAILAAVLLRRRR